MYSNFNACLRALALCLCVEVCVNTWSHKKPGKSITRSIRNSRTSIKIYRILKSVSSEWVKQSLNLNFNFNMQPPKYRHRVDGVVVVEREFNQRSPHASKHRYKPGSTSVKLITWRQDVAGLSILINEVRVKMITNPKLPLQYRLQSKTVKLVTDKTWAGGLKTLRMKVHLSLCVCAGRADA